MRTFHRLSPQSLPPKPRARARPARGAAAHPGPPSLLRHFLWPYAAKRPEGRQEAAGAAPPPLGQRGKWRRALGRSVALSCPMPLRQPRWAARPLCPCLDSRDCRLPRGSGAGVKLLGNNLKQPRGAECVRCCFKTFPNCCRKVPLFCSWGETAVKCHARRETVARFGATSVQNLTQNLTQNLRRILTQNPHRL